jgi:hypothetical protein
MHQVLYVPRDILKRAARRKTLDYPAIKTLMQMVAK